MIRLSAVLRQRSLSGVHYHQRLTQIKALLILTTLQPLNIADLTNASQLFHRTPSPSRTPKSSSALRVGPSPIRVDWSQARRKLSLDSLMSLPENNAVSLDDELLSAIETTQTAAVAETTRTKGSQRTVEVVAIAEVDQVVQQQEAVLAVGADDTARPGRVRKSRLLFGDSQEYHKLPKNRRG